MKISFWKIFWPATLGSLLVGLFVTIFAAILFSVILGSFANKFFGTPEDIKIEDNSVLHMTLDGDIGERTYTQFDYNTFDFRKETGLYDIIEGLKIAAEDKKIEGIFIEIEGISAGMASTKELRDALIEFKKSGKFIVAYSEYLGPKSYYLCSVSDNIYMFPTGILDWRGLGVEMVFLKELFEKLDVEMQIIRGSNNQFKSAVEPLMYSEMSEENRLQTTTFLNALWGEIKSGVTKEKGLNDFMLDSIANGVLIRKPSDAVNYKLIDEVKYKDEVIDILKKKSKIKDDEDLRLVDFDKYVKKKLKRERVLDKDENKNIAIIFAQGDIISGDQGEGIISSERISKAIREARLNEDIKAVVLRVNSPGGSALASDVIWREVVLTKEVKPIVVSMGDVAASGGYYISCAANKIFAQSNTITGSIGVFGIVPYLGDMFKNKLGVTFDRVYTNEHAVFSVNKKLSDFERDIVQQGVDDIYDDFISKVAEGRNMSKAEVDSIGQGRVWAGSDALSLGLVDELGGIHDAIREAAKLASIEEKEIKVSLLPELKNNELFDLIEMLDDSEDTSSDKISSLFRDYEKHVRSLMQMNGYQARLPFMFFLK